MDMEQLAERLRRDFGDAGVYALETSALTEADLALGYEHVLERIAPALEEELMHDNM